MVYNWNLIMKSLNICGVHIRKDLQKLVINGDLKALKEVLSKIKEIDSKLSTDINKENEGNVETIEEGKRNFKNNIGKGIVDIEHFDKNKELDKSESCLEFLLLSMCQIFNITPKQV